MFAKKSTAPTRASPPAEEAIVWSSVDPRNNAVVPYDPVSTMILESAFQQHIPEVELLLGGTPFVVKFSQMRQYNNSGGSRVVVRKGPKPSLPKPKLATAPSADITTAVLKQLELVDKAVEDLEKHEKSRSYKAPNPIEDTTQLIQIFDAMIAALYQERYQKKYGFDEDQDYNLLSIQFGQQVPAYFANVSDGQSIFHRKMLSLLGLRNLAKYGFEIFGEMKDKLFSGCIADYAAKTGPHKMKYYTGNVVDLDTCVLRCHEASTLATVNAMAVAQDLPPFENAQALASSAFGRRLAIEQSKMMIDDFVARFKLTRDEKKRRRVEMEAVSTENVYVASQNDDRGKIAMWAYINVGVLTFHVNVPTMADVYGALLKSPYHLAKAFLLVHQQSANAQELEANMDDFFENAVSDSCFNGKWKAIEAFCSGRVKIGTIDDVLNKLQASHQKEFLAIEDDDDGAKELSLMLKLAVGLQATDPATKTQRAIAAADVAAWHKKVMAAAA